MRYFCLLLLLACGCAQGEATGQKQIIPLEQVPASVLETAQKTLPEIKFDSALRMPNSAYEVRGKAKNGKIREVEISESGEVIEVE